MALTAWTEAQRALIGSLMLDPDLVSGELFQSAQSAHFGDPALRHIFEAARELWEANKPIDPVTVAAACGSEDYSKLIGECMKATPTAVNYRAWIDICRSRSRIAALQAEAMKIVSAEVTEAGAMAAYERMGELLRGTEDVEDLSLTELIGDYLDRMNDSTPPNYLSWGMEKLDKVLAVSPGKFVILAADSSVGKTALALQFAYHIAASGKRVGFFSIETDKESLTDRLMAERQIAGIPLPSTKAKTLTEDDLQRAGAAGMKSDRVPLRILRKADTLQAIRARTLMRKFDVIFIDYVQLIDAPGQERWDIVTGISMSLHRMAQQLGVTVVGLSQITPAAKGSKQAPTKDDLRESRQLKQDADVIMILSPSTDEGDPENTRILDVAKNKDGRCGKIKLRFEPQHMTFTELITISGLRAEGQAIKNQRISEGKKAIRKDNAKAAPTAQPPKLEELDDDEEEIPF
jgi:replicative DNA helicase